MKNFADLLQAARSKGPCRAVIAQAADESVLRAAMEAHREGIADPVFVADKKELADCAQASGMDLSTFRVFEPETRDGAAALAVELVRRGDGDILVKGMIHTADLLRAVLQKESGLGRGRILSHVGVFLLPESARYSNNLLLVTDAALAIAPSLAQKAEIVQNAIDLARRLGIQSPTAAILCAVETVNPAMPATLDAAALARMAERGQITGGSVEGPLALDNAVSIEAARKKGIPGKLAGRADILVAPDLEAANILYKSLVYFAGAEEAGIVVGASAPIVLTSRSDSAQNKLYSIALGVLAR
jgi:phosphate butyryltransferase